MRKNLLQKSDAPKFPTLATSLSPVEQFTDTANEAESNQRRKRAGCTILLADK